MGIGDRLFEKTHAGERHCVGRGHHQDSRGRHLHSERQMEVEHPRLSLTEMDINDEQVGRKILHTSGESQRRPLSQGLRLSVPGIVTRSEGRQCHDWRKGNALCVERPACNCCCVVTVVVLSVSLS